MNSYTKKLKYLAISFSVFGILFTAPLSTLSLSDDIPGSFREQKDEDGYIVNLKELIKRSKKQIDKVGVKIEEQARLRRNQQREQKAREYYDKAMRLYEEGKYDKAREYWDKAIKITEHKEMKGYMRQSAKKTKLQNKALNEQEKQRVKRLELERGYSAKEVEKKYDRAVRYYKQKKFVEAKVDFEDVEDMFPDHKATRSYLMVIDQEIESEQQRLIEEKLRQNAIVRGKEKEAWRRQLENQEKDRQKELQRQAEATYQEALRYYKDKDFVNAKKRFKEVEWILPDYKSTIKYLSRIDKDIRTQDLREENQKAKDYEKQLKDLQRAHKKDKTKAIAYTSHDPRQEAGLLYKEAVDLYKDKLYRQAQTKFIQIQRIDPDYKSSEKYLKKIAKRIGEKESEEITRKARTSSATISEKYFKVTPQDDQIKEAIEKRYEQFAVQADAKYTEALALYDTGKFIEAKRKFIETEAIYPDFKKTRKFLSNIDEDIERGVGRKISDRHKGGPAKKMDKEEVKAEKELKKKMADVEKAKTREAKLAEKERKKNEKLAKKQIAKEIAAKKKAEKERIKQEKIAKKRLIKERKEKERLARLKVKEEERNRKLMAKKEKSEEKKSIDVDRHEEVQEIKKSKEIAVKGEDQVRNEEQAKVHYDLALRLYKKKKYESAINEFKEADAYVKGYKLSEKYISYIHKILDKQEQQEVADADEKAEEKEYKIKKVRPTKEEKQFKREAKSHERKIRKEFKRMEADETDLREQRVHEMFEEAVSLYKAKNYWDAKLLFSNVFAINPRNAAAEDFIRRCEVAIEKENKKRVKENKKMAKLAVKERERAEREQLKKSGELGESLLAKRKEGIEENYKKAVELYKRDQLVLAMEELNNLDQLIVKGGFDDGYVKRMQGKISTVRKNVERQATRLKEQEIKRNEDFKVKTLKQKKADIEAALKQVKMLTISGEFSGARAQIDSINTMLKDGQLDREYVAKRQGEAKSLVRVIERKELESKNERAKLEKIRTKERIDFSIKEVRELIDAGQLHLAKEKLLSIERGLVDSSFDGGFVKRTQRKVLSMKRDIEKKEIKTKEDASLNLLEKKQEELESLYKQANQLVKNDRLGSAKEILLSIERSIFEGSLDAKFVSRMKKKVNSAQTTIEKREAQIAEEKREKEEELKKAKLQKKMDELTNMYKEAMGMIKDERLGLAKAQFKSIDQMLEENQLEERFVKKLQEKVMRGKKEVERIEMRAKEREERFRAKEEMRKAKEQLRAQKEKEEAERLANLEKQKAQEEADGKFKAQEEAIKVKIQEDQQKLAQLQSRKDVAQEKGGIGSDKKDAMSKKAVDLEKLVIMRQKEIEKERERIQEEFEQRLNDLYEQAVKLHKKGYNSEAMRMFEEIDEMSPNYKKTRKFIASLSKEMQSQNVIKEAKKAKKDPSQPSRVDIIADALDSVESDPSFANRNFY